MKTSGHCPKCACAKLYVVEQVRQPAHDSLNVIVPLVVTTAAVPGADVGLRNLNGHRAEIGSFDAWICASCGFTEWYAKDFQEAFDKLLSLGRRVHVRAVEAPAGTPFR